MPKPSSIPASRKGQLGYCPRSYRAKTMIQETLVKGLLESQAKLQVAKQKLHHWNRGTFDKVEIAMSFPFSSRSRLECEEHSISAS